MQNRVRVGGLFVAAAMSLTLFGCPKPKEETPGGNAPGGAPTKTGGGGDQKVKIAVIPKGTQHQFWQSVKAGALAAGEEEKDKVEVIWAGPDKEDDITSQINMVQNQASAGVSGVVLAAIDADALVKPVEALQAKGISVVTFDSGINKDVASCYVATNNVEGGKKGAIALAQAIGDKGNVGLLFFKRGSVSNDEREKGFKEELKNHPNIHLVGELEANNVQNALDQATNMMTAHPDIVGIFAANEPNGVGAANFLRQKKSANLKIVAYDTSDDEVKALNEGLIQALIVQDPYKMGYEGVKTALKAIRKQPIASKMVDTGVTVVTKENLNTPDVQKLINPTKK